MENKNTFGIGVVQMKPVFGDKKQNLKRSEELIRQAADAGAKIIVLPELCNTGYVFETREELYACAEPVNGASVKFWHSLAKELSVTIVAGMAELDDDKVRCYNSSVLIDSTGLIGHYRKLHLWGTEKLFFEPGNLGLPVFTTPLCRIGLIVCYDAYFPETFRLLALQGADLICSSANWVGHPPMEPVTMGYIQIMAGASSNHLYIAASDRVGEERGVVFAGKSLIVGPNGRPIGCQLNEKDEGIAVAEMDYFKAREIHNGDYNTAFMDRRKDVYDEMLGSRLEPLPR